MLDVAAPSVRVIHRHRIGRYAFTRVSPLTYLRDEPVAVLAWLNDGTVTYPGVIVTLDRAKLRPGGMRHLFLYDGETADPRTPTARPG